MGLLKQICRGSQTFIEEEIRTYLTSILDVDDPDQDAICLALLLYADVMTITGRHEEASDLRTCTSYTPHVPLWAIHAKAKVLDRYQQVHVIGIGICIEPGPKVAPFQSRKLNRRYIRFRKGSGRLNGQTRLFGREPGGFSMALFLDELQYRLDATNDTILSEVSEWYFQSRLSEAKRETPDRVKVIRESFGYPPEILGANATKGKAGDQRFAIQ